MVVTADQIAAVLGLPGIHSLRDLSERVLQGLPKSALERVLRLAIGKDAAERQKLLQRIVPLATYRRRTRLLKLEESERTERLARVIATAHYVWNGDKEGAHEFLISPHPMLDGRRPLDVALTELGAREVEDILGSLFYGIAA
jgi:putative toxin-antitoxin system antitoxin component (TIGR02293 family)